MKKLHVLNIAFQNEIRAQNISNTSCYQSEPVQLRFCKDFLDILSAKSPDKLSKFKQSLSETKVIKLTHILKRYRKLEMDNLMSKNYKPQNKREKYRKQTSSKSQVKEDKIRNEDLLATVDYLKQELLRKNKKIGEQETKIFHLTNKNKLKVQKLSRESLIKDLNLFGQSQLKRMIVDAKSFYQKSKHTNQSKREAKSAAGYKKILKRSKICIKKPLALENKQTFDRSKQVNKLELKFRKKQKCFDINEGINAVKSSRVTEGNTSKKDIAQGFFEKSGSSSIVQITENI